MQERWEQKHRAGGRCADPLPSLQHQLQEPHAPRPPAVRADRPRQQAGARQGHCRLYLHRNRYPGT